jgi:mono/diheme cytochrome c family protein
LPEAVFQRRHGTAVASAVALAIGLALLWRGAQPAAAVDFDVEIRPLLNETCAACHGGVKRESGLSLLSRTSATEAAQSGRPALVPGRPRESELIRRVAHSDPSVRMPPHGDALDGEEIDRLERWIRQGAPWPPHWAYLKPAPVEPPPVSDPYWPSNGIDHFILARIEAEGLTPNPLADCATLIRRVSLDLIGLPPTPEQVELFCGDDSTSAYEALVDRLLASPHFGEHWAAMWLDLARYADSKGYERDPHRTIWKYRDWVIRAFNEDLPFDEFTIQQLAGDLLPDPTVDQLIATAFHRNTMTNTEGGTDDEEFRIAAVLDRVNTTMEVWQGTTMACVQCHGHPYDPFDHEEYYRFFAFFNNTRDADRADERPLIATFDEARRSQGERLLHRIEGLERRIEELLRTPEVRERQRLWEERLRGALSMSLDVESLKEADLPADVMRVLRSGASDLLVEILKIAYLPEEDRPYSGQAHLMEFYASVAPEFEDLRRRLEALRKELELLEPVWTPIMRELPTDRRRVTRVFHRGNWLAPGEEVEPGVPAVLNGLPGDLPPNRLGLARWLVSPENPLSARVAVNRFWARLFGTGLVATLEDFGTQGARPTHPELLDWLALRFIEQHRWSVKALLKELVLSATYRQTSRVTPEELRRDPRNRLLARGPRVRLSAEQIRDQALFVGGLLSPKMYGASVMPPQPDDIWRNPHSRERWRDSEGEDRYRRAVYTYWKRTHPYPSMAIFDAPSREVCVSGRFRTGTPLQALVTLNDPVFVEAARGLALRMLEQGGADPRSRVARGYELALGRRPEPEALEPLMRLYEEAAKHYRDQPDDAARFLRTAGSQPSKADVDPLSRRLGGAGTLPVEAAALTVVGNAILNLDPFIMKE